MMEAIYDRKGKLVGWLEQDIVYSGVGCPRAFMRGGAVYSFGSAYLGWFDRGYFRDSAGAATAWTRGARGGPATPAPTEPSERPFLQFALLPSLPPLPPLRPVPSQAWSAVAWDDYLGPDALRAQVSRGNPPTMEDIARLLDEDADSTAWSPGRYRTDQTVATAQPA